jgi:hypothetical protein
MFQVTEKEGFTWKGHSALTVRTHEIKMASGYQPSCVVQVNSSPAMFSCGFSGFTNVLVLVIVVKPDVFAVWSYIYKRLFILTNPCTYTKIDF